MLAVVPASSGIHTRASMRRTPSTNTTALGSWAGAPGATGVQFSTGTSTAASIRAVDSATVVASPESSIADPYAGSHPSTWNRIRALGCVVILHPFRPVRSGCRG